MNNPFGDSAADAILGAAYGGSGTNEALRAAYGGTNEVLRAAYGNTTDAALRAAYGNSGTSAILRKAFGELPYYSVRPAVEAIRRVRELHREKILSAGLYYLVLTDLVGSTEASAKLGVDANVRRIERFIRLTQQALGTKPSGHFLKEVGDASLLVFSSFSDILKWHQKLVRSILVYNQRITGRHTAVRRFAIKTVIHLGEVAFGRNLNPIALAVNQIFKIEKNFNSGDLGCTEAVHRTLTSRIAAGELRARKVKSITLPGEVERSSLWRLVVRSRSRPGATSR